MFFKKEPLSKSYNSALSKKQKKRTLKTIAEYCNTPTDVLPKALVIVDPKIYFVNKRVMLLSTALKRLQNEITKINRLNRKKSNNL